MPWTLAKTDLGPLHAGLFAALPSANLVETLPMTWPMACCRLGARPALFLLYTGVGNPDNYRLLNGCPGVVVYGSKKEKRPPSSLDMTTDFSMA